MHVQILFEPYIVMYASTPDSYRNNNPGDWNKYSPGRPIHQPNQQQLEHLKDLKQPTKT